MQISQVGAQLSLALYKVARTLGSANKVMLHDIVEQLSLTQCVQDVRYVAKDIALFAAVLKNLGETFERGRESMLYREDAYKTSMVIVEQCKEVFHEIDTTIEKFRGDTTSEDTSISLGRTDKVMWIFRKSRIQELGRNLESLKATIQLQVAVLSYADRISSASYVE